MRSSTTAALSLGSNLGDRRGALRRAVSSLAGVPGWQLRAVSPLYETKPVGGPSQPEFLNAVVELATVSGEPLLVLARQLLAAAQQVERDLGRTREVRWDARTLDVDVLAVADLECAEPGLTLPHQRIRQRAFVLVPWAEIDPEFRIPGHGPVRELSAALPPDAVRDVRRVKDRVKDRDRWWR